MMQHPYDILGLSAQASHDEIRRRYRSLILIYHPDRLIKFSKGKERDAAEQKGKDIMWAYELLTNPVKLKAFEESAKDSRKIMDLSKGIEYLRYDEEGKPIGLVPRSSDRYQKLFNDQVEEFRVFLPQKAELIDKTFSALSDIREASPSIFTNGSNSFATVYDFILYKNSLDIKDTADAEATPAPKIANDYAVILNVFKHFFNGAYYGDRLKELKSDIKILIGGELDIRMRELLGALKSIVKASQVNPSHYPDLVTLYNVMYSAIDSSSQAPIQLMADRGFQQYVRTVQDYYLQRQNPQHLTKEWLFNFHSDKSSHHLNQHAKQQTYAQLEKEFATAFKEEDEPETSEEEQKKKLIKKSEAIIEQACKQVDMSAVTFMVPPSDNHTDEDDTPGNAVQEPQYKKRKADSILPKQKQAKRMLCASIGKANHYLLSAIAFQTNARSEREPARIAAGEYVALDLYRSAISEVRKASSITRLYVYYQVLSGILAFEYQGEMITSFIKTVYSEFNLISQFMPLISMPTSHNDIDKFTQMDEKYLYQVLDHISTDENHSIQERMRAAYLLFEGAYNGTFPAEKFDQLRLRSMETYLQSKGLSMASLSEHLHPANSVLTRSPTGFINPTDELNIPDIDGGRIIADIKGFEIDPTGKLKFEFVYWEEGMPRSLRLMTDVEFYDMLQYDLPVLDKAWFTLDAPDSLMPHLPLQEAISNLPDIPLHQTMLDADYAALKFFTTTTVSGAAPFEFKDTAEMIAHLPPHLIEVLMTKQNNAAGYFYNSTDPSRYWYKVDFVEREMASQNGAITCQIGQVKLILAHQKMVIDTHGKMVDDLAEDELGLIINKAVKDNRELEKLIAHVVDKTEKTTLDKSLNELKKQDDLLQAAKQEIKMINSDVERDATILKKDKQKTITLLSKESIQKLRSIEAEIRQIQDQLKKPLKEALDLNKVFVRRFSEHMDEIANYIPIIKRMQLFVKLNAMKDAFSKIRVEHAANAQIMQQLDLLKINQVKIHEVQSPKKVYVPAAIRRDVEGGFISFGGVSLQMRYTNIRMLIDSKIAQADVLSNLGKPYSLSDPTAEDIQRARFSYSYSKMNFSDRIQTEKIISACERKLEYDNRSAQFRASHMTSREQYSNFSHSHFGFPPMPGSDYTQCPPPWRQPTEFYSTIPSYMQQPAAAAAAVPPPPWRQPSQSFSAVPPYAQQSAAAAATPASPAIPPYRQSEPDPIPTFFLPPHFDFDPYAQARLSIYQHSVTTWQAELPVYQAAGQVLSQPAMLRERSLFDELRIQADSVIGQAQRIAAPFINKFARTIQGVEHLLDPISTIMMPQPLLTFAATVVAMAQMPEAHASLSTPDYQLAKEIVRYCPALYDSATQELRSGWMDYADIIVPGVFPITANAFRGGFAISENATTLDALGIPPCPPRYHPAADSRAANPMNAMMPLHSPSDLRSLPNHLNSSLLFVINQEGRLNLHPYLTDADSSISSNPNTQSLYFNPETKNIEPISVMGIVHLQQNDVGPNFNLLHIAEKYKNIPNIRQSVLDTLNRQGFSDFEMSGHFASFTRPTHTRLHNNASSLVPFTWCSNNDDLQSRQTSSLFSGFMKRDLEAVSLRRNTSETTRSSSKHNHDYFFSSPETFFGQRNNKRLEGHPLTSARHLGHYHYNQAADRELVLAHEQAQLFLTNLMKQGSRYLASPFLAIPGVFHDLYHTASHLHEALIQPMLALCKDTGIIMEANLPMITLLEGDTFVNGNVISPYELQRTLLKDIISYQNASGSMIKRGHDIHQGLKNIEAAEGPEKVTMVTRFVLDVWLTHKGLHMTGHAAAHIEAKAIATLAGGARAMGNILLESEIAAGSQLIKMGEVASKAAKSSSLVGSVEQTFKVPLDVTDKYNAFKESTEVHHNEHDDESHSAVHP